MSDVRWAPKSSASLQHCLPDDAVELGIDDVGSITARCVRVNEHTAFCSSDLDTLSQLQGAVLNELLTQIEEGTEAADAACVLAIGNALANDPVRHSHSCSGRSVAERRAPRHWLPTWWRFMRVVHALPGGLPLGSSSLLVFASVHCDICIG
jgi:hypothetical protein